MIHVLSVRMDNKFIPVDASEDQAALIEKANAYAKAYLDGGTPFVQGGPKDELINWFTGEDQHTSQPIAQVLAMWPRLYTDALEEAHRIRQLHEYREAESRL